jgi:hypothetical protein
VICKQIEYIRRLRLLFILYLIMSSPVELYVYDLSNGMARQLSVQLTGRQIDGIW